MRLLPEEPICNPHPKAPHGFDRNRSHTEHRYVCECEGWDAYEAGYHDGYQAAVHLDAYLETSNEIQAMMDEVKK